MLKFHASNKQAITVKGRKNVLPIENIFFPNHKNFLRFFKTENNVFYANYFRRDHMPWLHTKKKGEERLEPFSSSQ